jgi:outer membrane protein OmpA-like peptidoglycan-associated protein
MLVVLLVTVLPVAGCATKKYVRAEVAAVEASVGEQIDGVESQVEDLQTRTSEQDVQMGEISQTAREAMERAQAAGKLAEGKFLYETLLTDDRVGFGFDESALSDGAAEALDGFAAELKAANENVFIEIQGHTDSTGGEQYNLLLGERRAEAVRRYLSSVHGLALHRMSIISYGMSAPIADNGTPEGRAQNRRVTLVVLQ